MSFAPLRQRSKSTLLLFFIWSAYLLADWVAALAIGLITQSQTDLCESDESSDDLFAFWASFLLLHLGGPDSIISFALEDNELWLRHLLGLVLQVMGAAYSIYLTLPNNKLWLPTLLVFVVGLIKYAERTHALYLASSNRFMATSLPEPNPGPDYEEVVARRYVEISTQEKNNPVDHDPSETNGQGNDLGEDSDGIFLLLKVAHEFYESFKGLFVGLLPSPEIRSSIRNALMELPDPVIAFRIIEYELSFLYEVLHTKVVLAPQKIGYIVRFMSFSFIVTSMFFYFSVEKHDFDKFDIGVTYSLLIGAIVLDAISFIQLIFSDGTLVALSSNNCIWRFFLFARRRRWSGSISQYNLISYCLHERPIWLYKLADYFHARGTLNKIRIGLFSWSEKVSEDKMALIFDSLKRDLEDVNFANPREMIRGRYSAGRFTRKDLRDSYKEAELVARAFSESLVNFHSREREMTKSFLGYHLATDLYLHLAYDSDDEQLSMAEREAKRSLKHFSNYVFYLIVMKQEMVASMFGNTFDEIFHDTCDEIKRFFDEHKISHHSGACNKILEKYCTSIEGLNSLEAIRGRSKSVFPDACNLTVQLFSVANEESAVERLRDAWTSFLLVASLSCSPMVHAEQLSRGGEFLTFFWLLAAHFGLTPAQQDIIGTFGGQNH